LQKELKLSSRNALRFIDDHTIAIRTDLDEGRINYALSRELAEFELELNFAKTRHIGVGGQSEPSWVSELALFSLDRFRQKKALDRYFERAFHLADEFPDANVLRYAMRRASSFPVGDDEWSHFQLLLQQAVRRSGGSLISDFSTILVNANFKGRPVAKEEAKEFAHDLILRSSPLRYTHEVAWCLFLAKALKLPVTAEVCKGILEMESSVCSLILVDLFNRKLVTHKLAAALWKKYLNSDGLRSPLWLLVYELHRKEWLELKARGSFVDNNAHFGPLLKNGVFFYDEKKNVQKLEKERRVLRAQRQRIRFVFAHLDEYF
jgi:hypothetical protein